jgi:hypothetical protein
LAFLLAVAAEFRRAIAATHRYDRLRVAAHAPDEAAVSPARRTYLEFYHDGAQTRLERRAPRDRGRAGSQSS